jgi:formylmethanofuran--tetrahydromethanopterin N-formyltransferase
MQINGVEIEDTFAEAFKMYGNRLIISAVTEKWAMEAASRMTGFATSVIGCGCEAGIESEVSSSETPDGRPGVSVLIFTMGKKGLAEQLVNRVGQTVMTCPTTACFNGLESKEEVKVGGKLRYFGDGFQISKLLDGRRLWRIPVMDGEFIVEDSFGIQKAVGGGNFLILGKSPEVTLKAAEDAVEAGKRVKGVVMPFPGGIVRSGSKTSSKYKFLHASTNTAFCPTIKQQIESQLPEEVNCVLEIVIDSLDEGVMREAMKLGIKAACIRGIQRISAGNYRGTLGQYQIYLHELLR